MDFSLSKWSAVVRLNVTKDLQLIFPKMGETQETEIHYSGKSCLNNICCSRLRRPYKIWRSKIWWTYLCPDSWLVQMAAARLDVTKDSLLFYFKNGHETPKTNIQFSRRTCLNNICCSRPRRTNFILYILSHCALGYYIRVLHIENLAEG